MPRDALLRAQKPDPSPLARIPTLRQLSLYGVSPTTPGYDALRRDRPDVFIFC